MKTAAAFLFIGMLIGALISFFVFVYPLANKKMDCNDCYEKLTRCRNTLKDSASENQEMTVSDLKTNAILNQNSRTEANMMVDTITVGDGSYVPINITGEAGENAETILRALNVFKESNPDMEIVSYQVHAREGIPGVVPPRVYGLFILHRSASGSDSSFEITP